MWKDNEFKRRFMKSYAPWPSLITTAQWTFPRWMVYIFIEDSPFSNHNIFYKLDKLTSHLTRRKANINCSKGHSVQFGSTLNCHQNRTIISSIMHLTRMFQNLEINCLLYRIHETDRTIFRGKFIEYWNPNYILTKFSCYLLNQKWLLDIILLAQTSVYTSLLHQWLSHGSVNMFDFICLYNQLICERSITWVYYDLNVVIRGLLQKCKITADLWKIYMDSSRD